MISLVMDASVAVSWLKDEPPAPFALEIQKRLLSGVRAFVPSLWHLEVANALIVAERRRLLTWLEIQEILPLLETIVSRSIETVSDVVPVARSLRSSMEHKLTAYDCVYLDLAREMNLPIATLDRALRAATIRAGVQLVR